MTREMKIGMLVGLGIIVLIGVLMSDILGSGASTQQTADLGRYQGEQYRADLQKDVGVPSIQAEPGSPTGRQAPQGEMAMAVMDGGGPVVGQPATIEQAGAIPPDGRADGSGPMALAANGLGGQSYAPGNAAAAPTAVASQIYIIQKNDTVKSVAKKFYKTAGTADMARIVAANPGMLKDASTMLVIGRKLTIPMDAAAVGGMVNNARPATPVGPGPAVSAPAAPGTHTYTVVQGDTISSIAKKFLGTGGPIAVGEVLKANGLKEGAVLKLGMSLKIPVRTGGSAGQ